MNLADSAGRRDGALARAHPLTMFGLDALIAGAARLRPARIAAGDASTGAELDHAELDRRVAAFRADLRGFDFQPGERILLFAAPSSATLVTLIGIISAGLEPVAAPLGLSIGALAAGARAVSAAALVAPASVGGQSLEELVFGVASQAPSVRLIGSLGPGTIDGAVDFGPRSRNENDSPTATRAAPSKKVLIGALDQYGAPQFHEQAGLISASLGLIAKAHVNGSAPLLSLVSPGSIGGLVAGPLASLLSGAALHFLSPFDGAAFLAALDALGPVRLVAPRAVMADLDAAGLLTSGAVLACIAVHRAGEEEQGFEPSHPYSCPIVEIGADGAIRPTARGASGRATY
ncbi:AMP-dependent synthetase [Methylosinus sp. H3A]|uniref:AMP-dependent synthetase n=1 Tax=Methylosinus sp. H3A TaxID=2785786 RepID=UPI00289F1225|nr:AMP-dependent synthetase [Methylosinus sp. H3A]